MKKQILLLLIFFLFLLTACGRPDTRPENTAPDTTVSTESYETVTEEGVSLLDPASIGGATWQEAYRSVILCDRQKLLADPDNLRYPEDTYIYLGIHDFEGDGIPELIFGDGVSLAVFTFSEGAVIRIADLCFPGIVWCVNGVAFQGSGMSVMCAGSGGTDYVNFGYIDGQYVLGLYAPREHMEPTINGKTCTVEDINRIHTTDYDAIAQEAFREKMQLVFENGQWILKLPSGEEVSVDETLDFMRFLWE